MNSNEHHLYGSSRLGVKTHKRVLLRKEFSISGFEEDGTYITDVVTDSLVYVASSEYFCRVLAQKQYELSNHLGNVLATVLDRRTGVFDEGADTLMYYVADVVSATLYYPFGSSLMSYSNMNFNYSYGMNTQEKDDEIYGKGNSYSAEYWQYDARLGRRWNVDPRPNPSISVYACFGNNPILFSDAKGDTFDIQSQQRVNEFKKTTQGYLDDTNEQISKLAKEMDKDISAGKDVSQQQSQMRELKLLKFEYTSALGEISRLEKSTQMYSIQNSDKGFNYVSKKGSVFVMHINNNSIPGLAHELKHAYQYDIGALSFSRGGEFEGMTGMLADIHDEIEAYQRQWAYGEMPIIVNNYSEINSNYVLRVGKAHNLDYYKLLDVGFNVTKNTIINEAIYNKWFSKDFTKEEMIGRTMGEVLNYFNKITPFEDFR